VTMVTAMTQYTTELSYAAIAEVVNEEVMIMPMIEDQEGAENVESVLLEVNPRLAGPRIQKTTS